MSNCSPQMLCDVVYCTVWCINKRFHYIVCACGKVLNMAHFVRPKQLKLYGRVTGHFQYSALREARYMSACVKQICS